MGAGAIIEPAVVLTLLFGGTWINRNVAYSPKRRPPIAGDEELIIPGSPLSVSSNEPLLQDGNGSRSPSLFPPFSPDSRWRRRRLRLWGFGATVRSPNTEPFANRWLSRVLMKFPFLMEVLYWALIYWVYQLGRAFTAVTLVQGTVHTARRHALQLIRIEQRLHLFSELVIQRFFLDRPALLVWINRTYSFIHIPGTILFLVWLYWYTTTRNRIPGTSVIRLSHVVSTRTRKSLDGPAVYQARRRTMALCNLIAFIVFTAWPCMPPRLLSDPNVKGPSGEEARSYGFVDTVHGDGGEGSVWTQNKFCNQYAAMPSLHFGYSLLIGLTVGTIPLHPRNPEELGRRVSVRGVKFTVHFPSLERILCVLIGFLYPFTILVAIIATANHFILDAVAGAIVCGLAWYGNRVMLNLLPLQDWFLWCIRTHLPETRVVNDRDLSEEEDESDVDRESILPK